MPALTRSVLFVDEERRVLDGYRRSLRPMSAEWNMFFCSSGREALELLRSEPVQVFVCDMRLSDFSGVALFEKVRDEYPQALRVALTGQVDQEAMFRSSGLVHKYLSKPCPPETIKGALESVIMLRENLENEQLKALISRMETVPSLPILYHEILSKLRSPDCSIREIGQIISRDISMTAKILKLVNSAYFGLRQYVSDPVRAAVYLGLETIKNLVLAIHVFAQFDESKIQGMLLDTIWRHSLFVGTLAKKIAHFEARPAQMIDDCFVSGLLHDVGKLVLAANLPDEYQQCLHLVRERKVAPMTAERTIFGADHATIGAFLLRLWGIPDPVVEAVTYHHTPADNPFQQILPLTFIHVANAFHHSKLDIEKDIYKPEIDTSYLQTLGIEDRIDLWQDIEVDTDNSDQ